MILFFIQLIYSIPNYEISADRKNLTIKGFNEIVDKESYQNTGSTKIYTHIEVQYGIIELGDSALTKSEELLTINLPITLKSIGKSCFSFCEKLKTIKIPEGIEKINSGLFSFCYKLQTIDIPSSLKHVDSPFIYSCNLFQQFITHEGGWFSTLNNGTFLVLNKTIGVACAPLSNLIVPSEIETLSVYFLNQLTTVKSITFTGNKLKYIQDNAFGSATSLTSLTLPSGVLSIGASFISSSGVTSLTIPSTLTHLSSQAFDGAHKLNEVIVEGDCTAVHMDSQGVIYNEDSTTVMFIPPGIKRFNITQSVKNLNIDTLKNNENLTELYVDDGNEKYSSDGKALYNKDQTELICGIGGVKNISVSAECKIIRENAFSKMNVEILEFLGNKTEGIRGDAFRDTQLHTAIFPEGIRYFDGASFHSAKLKHLKLPSTVEQLSDQCFINNLLETIDLSECKNIKGIGHATFLWNYELREVKLPPTFPYIGSSQFGSSKITKISIPPSVTKIESEGFASSQLETITFEGNNITYIGENAFMGTRLREIEIPNSVTEIRNGALSSCGSLTSIIIHNESSLATIQNDIIKGSNSITNIWFPASLRSISESALGLAMGLKNISFDKANTKYVGRNGLAIDIEKKEVIVCGGGVSSASISSDILSIGPSAFLNCTNLDEVIFSPESKMQFIGKSTFLGCSSLSTLSLPRFMERIESNAFSNCVSLTSVDFGRTHLPMFLKSIGDEAFSGCSALESIEIPSSLNSVGKLAFSNCKKLKYINFGQNVTEIGEKVFKNCQELIEIHFCLDTKANLSGISSEAFSFVPDQTLIYITNSFKSSMLGGHDVLRVLDEDCAVPTARFTLADVSEPFGIMSTLYIVIHAGTDAEGDNEGGNK